MPKRKGSIKEAIAEAVEMELAQAKAIGWSEEGRRLDEELDFDTPNFGDITEDEYD
jgi:hypothetical protein